MQTPFQIKTPENLNATEITKLFVDLFSDHVNLTDSGHTFIDGARGTGKSMLLRYLEPDVQMKTKSCEFNSLPFLAIHVPLRMPCFNLKEFEVYKGFPYFIFTEHILVSRILVCLLEKLVEMSSDVRISTETFTKMQKSFHRLLLRGGCIESEINFINEKVNAQELLDSLIEYIEDNGSKVSNFLNKAQLAKDSYLNYDLPIFKFYDTLYPLCKDIKKWGWTPNATIFLMLDDADWLPAEMQKIINTWVASRTTQDVCFKITTQLKYKQWRTINGDLILESHDFNRINLGTIYTAKKDQYSKKIKDVIKKRLVLFGITEITPDEYFPEDQQQKEAIDVQREKLRREYEANKNRHRSNTIHDHLGRYAVSEYMKSIPGSSKNAHNYKYSGLDTIIDISDGAVRTFLDIADKMFSDQKSMNKDKDITFIAPEIQNRVLKEQAENLFLRGPDDNLEKALKSELRNLVNSLGKMFHAILTSDVSERRVISIVIQENIPEHIVRLFDLGIEHGYFKESTIGSKSGHGRSIQYILTKRLAPFFLLDPAGYSGYKQVSARHLEIAIKSPDKFVKQMRSVKIDSGNLFVDEEIQ